MPAASLVAPYGDSGCGSADSASGSLGVAVDRRRRGVHEPLLGQRRSASSSTWVATTLFAYLWTRPPARATPGSPARWKPRRSRPRDRPGRRARSIGTKPGVPSRACRGCSFSRRRSWRRSSRRRPRRSVVEQPLGQMRPDEPRATGDETLGHRCADASDRIGGTGWLGERIVRRRAADRRPAGARSAPHRRRG